MHILLSNFQNDWSLIGQSFFLILFCAVLIIGAVYGTKWINRAKLSGRLHGNLHVIEAISVGFQNTLQLVKAGEHFFLIGVSKDRITLISELEPEEIKQYTQENAGKNMFDKYLNQFIKRDKNLDCGDEDEKK